MADNHSTDRRPNPGHTGHKHSPESIAKMRAARLGRKFSPHSPEHRAKISEANRGKIREPKYQKTCGACGSEFLGTQMHAKFCSTECKRAIKGHGIRHLPVFRAFEQKCAICNSLSELVGDHDHETGRPRGILCRKCNLAIGNMLDDPVRLRAAAAYLEASI